MQICVLPQLRGEDGGVGMSDLIDREALLDECLNHYEVGNIEQNCTMDWICKTVRNFPAAPRWVRCEEELPEKEGDYLVWTMLYGGHAYTDYYTPKYGWDEYKVIAWMPLQEPPKEDA